MAIKQSNLEGYIVTYDGDTNRILSVKASESYQERKEKATLEVLSKMNEFKQRGIAVVKPELAENWCELVNNSLTDLKQAWYNGVCIEATLTCMEMLSQGEPAHEVYKQIDIQDPDFPCVFLGMELSGWQNASITGMINSFHERGQEFCNYRNNHVNNHAAPVKKELTQD